LGGIARALGVLWHRLIFARYRRLGHKLSTQVNGSQFQMDPTTRVPRGLRVSMFSGPDAKRRRGKRPPVEFMNTVEPRSGRAGDISSLLSVRYRRQAHCPVRFLFPIFKICAIVALGSQKRPRARQEARRAWIAGRLLRSRRGSILIARRCGGASSHVHARRRRPPRVESVRKAAHNVLIWNRL